MKQRIYLGLVVAMLISLTCSSAQGQEVFTITLEKLVSGLNQPVYITPAGDRSGRLFIVEQTGRIKIFQNGALLPTPFLDIASTIIAGGERGLLSVAFHPKYSTNRRFFVDYTRAGDGATVIAEYKTSEGDPNVADTSERILLIIPQPFANHNGGQLQFGPDGYLYIGMGDGGSGGDPQNHAQDLSSHLGKLLTIDVDARRPVVAVAGYGRRNPWRFSFDKGGNLYIGDVGQDSWEEIDYTPRSSPGIENY